MSALEALLARIRPAQPSPADLAERERRWLLVHDHDTQISVLRRYAQLFGRSLTVFGDPT